MRSRQLVAKLRNFEHWTGLNGTEQFLVGDGKMPWRLNIRAFWLAFEVTRIEDQFHRSHRAPTARHHDS